MAYHYEMARPVFHEMLRFADDALAHEVGFGGFAEDLFGDLRPRLWATLARGH